jgi:hypothetical protein
MFRSRGCVTNWCRRDVKLDVLVQRLSIDCAYSPSSFGVLVRSASIRGYLAYWPLIVSIPYICLISNTSYAISIFYLISMGSSSVENLK